MKKAILIAGIILLLILASNYANANAVMPPYRLLEPLCAAYPQIMCETSDPDGNYNTFEAGDCDWLEDKKICVGNAETIERLKEKYVPEPNPLQSLLMLFAIPIISASSLISAIALALAKKKKWKDIKETFGKTVAKPNLPEILLFLAAMISFFPIIWSIAILLSSYYFGTNLLMAFLFLSLFAPIIFLLTAITLKTSEIKRLEAIEIIFILLEVIWFFLWILVTLLTTSI